MKKRQCLQYACLAILVIALSGCDTVEDFDGMLENEMQDVIDSDIEEIVEEAAEEIISVFDAEFQLDDSVWSVGHADVPVAEATNEEIVEEIAEEIVEETAEDSTQSTELAKIVLNTELSACVKGTNLTTKSMYGHLEIESYLGKQGVPFVYYADYEHYIFYDVTLSDTTGNVYEEWENATYVEGETYPQYNCFSDDDKVMSILISGTNCIETVFSPWEEGVEITTELLNTELNQPQEAHDVKVLVDNGVDTVTYKVFTYTIDGCVIDLYYYDDMTLYYIKIYEQ
ncbi:MAG: hypothetical protein R3Y67_08990 [Eubacteriales bacterium]